MPDVHALLAPSAAKRWMKCHPSARLEESEPESNSIYAKEGSVAHSLAETLLRLNRDCKNTVASDTELLSTRVRECEEGKWDLTESWAKILSLKKEAEALGADFFDMLETVNENYATVVYSDYVERLKTDPEATLLIEQRFNLESFVPGGFGSSDAVLVGAGKLTVYDLKYGKGVKVDADHNEQMMCYALGALCGPGELYIVDTVEMVIIQPRLRHESRWNISEEGLRAWGFDTLRPNAWLAFQGEGDLVPGDHCQFCKVKARCRALLQMAEACHTMGEDPKLLSDEELANVLGKVDVIERWCASVQEYALQLAQSGTEIPGWKVVEGRSIRKIVDQQEAFQRLEAAGLEPDTYLKPKELRTITELERRLRKKAFAELLGDLVVKPEGKPTLAPESDPRPPFEGTSKNDFQ